MSNPLERLQVRNNLLDQLDDVLARLHEVEKLLPTGAASEGELHDPVTLGAGSDPILTLTDQELTLGDVATQAELDAHAGDPDAHHNWPLQDGDIPSSIARDSEVTTAINNHAADDDAHHDPVTVADTNSVDLEVTGQQISAALRRASGGHLSEDAGGVSVDEASTTQPGVVELATDTGAPETTAGLALQASDAPAAPAANRIVRLSADGALILPGNVWRIGSGLALDADFTTSSSKATWQALGIRFSDDDTPFPLSLRWPVSGAWSWLTSYGFYASSASDGGGPAMLIPLMRPGNWRLETEIYCGELATADRVDIHLGHVAASNHVGESLRVRVYSVSSTAYVGAYIETNDGDDTFSTRNVLGTATNTLGTWKFRVEKVNACFSVMSTTPGDVPYSAASYTGRQSAGIAFTPAYAFVQVYKHAGYNLALHRIGRVTLTYLL